MASDEKKDGQNGVADRVDGVFKTSSSADPESEPCLQRKSRGQEFWDNTEKKLLEKSGLTQRGLYVVLALLSVLLLLLIVIILLGSLWPSTPHHLRFPVCRHASCLRASSQIQQYMNESASKCEDVTTWACGGWLAQKTLPNDRSKWNKYEQIEIQESERIRDLITTFSLPLSMGTVEWKLKHFYEACVEVDNVNADGHRPLTTIIEELGGWSFLRNFNLADFDVNVIMRHLHVKYGATPFFKIAIVPNPRIPGTSSIMILPAGLGLPDKTYYYMRNEKVEKTYKQFIRDVIMLLGRPTTSEAEKNSNDMFYYERRIAEITPDSIDLQNPLNTNNVIKLSELKITTPNLPFLDILSAMFPSARIDEDTEVIVAQPEYLLKVSQIVSSTDRTTLNSYLMWTLVKEYIPFLSSKFQAVVDAYRREFYGVKEPLERWEFCSNLVQRFMPLAVDSILDARNPVSNFSRIVVSDLFRNVVRGARKHLQKYKNIPDLYMQLEKKLDNIKLQIGLRGIDDNNSSFLKGYYSKFSVLKANLFETLKNGVTFLKKLEEKTLLESMTEDYIIKAATSKPFRVSYVPSSNKVVVPRALLNSPYFEPGYPSSVNYGRLGVQVANAVISSILPFNSAWTADKKLLSPFHQVVNESMQLIENSMACLSKISAERSLLPFNAYELTSLSAFKYLSSLEVAQEALNFQLEHKEHVHQPALEIYEDNTLFYLSALQDLCSISTKEQDVLDTIVHFQTPDKNMVSLISYQSLGMAEALDCPSSNLKCRDIF